VVCFFLGKKLNFHDFAQFFSDLVTNKEKDILKNNINHILEIYLTT
jgi:hypothetical protein